MSYIDHKNILYWVILLLLNTQYFDVKYKCFWKENCYMVSSRHITTYLKNTLQIIYFKYFYPNNVFIEKLYFLSLSFFQLFPFKITTFLGSFNFILQSKILFQHIKIECRTSSLWVIRTYLKFRWAKWSGTWFTPQNVIKKNYL